MALSNGQIVYSSEENAERVAEALAAYAHQAWSHWMKYLFSKCEQGPDGEAVIPAELRRRWERQMYTAYADLPEAEQLSDREEAAKILKVILLNS